MNPVTTRIRKPVRREGAEKYLLWTLLSFAGSVIFTRVLLELTGYPQLGGSQLHIAHVLWGGLILYAASLVPLIYANRWVYILSAVLGGVGIGLFIDEVGKFITQSNDYFYPPAAPIIYALFLISVLIYNNIRRPRKREVREELYSVLEGLEEVLDHDLSNAERQKLIERLDGISAQTNQPDLERLIRILRDFASGDVLYLAPEQPGLIDRWLMHLQSLEKRYIKRPLFRAVFAGGLLGTGFWLLYFPVILLIYSRDPSYLEPQVLQLIQSRLVASQLALNVFEARLVLQAGVGISLIISVVFIALRREKLGLQIAYFSLLLALTTVNLLVFYFDQFSTILIALVETGLFLSLLYYRRKYFTT